jgi:hypothetical protein
MELIDLKNVIEEDLDKQLISPNVLLSKFRMLSEDSRKSPNYIDPRNMPFYYHLGKYLKPNVLLEVGFDLGLRSGCFLKSCNTVKHLLAQSNDRDSVRLGIKNIRDIFKGKFDLSIGDLSIKLKLDLVIINDDLEYEEYRNIFDLVYAKLMLDGFMIVGYAESNLLCKDALKAFCKIHNRKSVLISTRYGTRIIKK